MSHALLAYGPPGLLILAVLDSAGVPVIGGVDALLVAIAVQKPDQAFLAAIFAIIGSVAGSLFLFFLARKGGDVFLNKHVSRGTGKRMHAWFQRYGLITVFVPALSPIPLPMKIPVFCAGALQVRLEYFVLVVLVARIVRYFGLAYLSEHYGMQTFSFVRAHMWEIGLGALAVALIAMLALRLLQKREAAMGIPQ